MKLRLATAEEAALIGEQRNQPSHQVTPALCILWISMDRASWTHLTRKNARGAPVYKVAQIELDHFLFDLPERTSESPVAVCPRSLGRCDVTTNKITPTVRFGRSDRGTIPPSEVRTRIRRLTNRRKVQTRAASSAAANKEIRYRQ